MSTKKKIRRYKNLIKNFSNWPQYLMFKMWGKKPSFEFRLRDSFSIEVPRQMLSSFRECFFDQIYIKHIPPRTLKQEKPIIVDIGANAGFFSLFMFYLYPKATVYSFEPMPFNFEVLEKYRKNYPSLDWHLASKAVSNKSQRLILHASKLDGYTTMASIFENDKNTRHIEVESIPLTQVMKSHGIDKIDILKLDCEGSEYQILYSLPETELRKINTLMIETHKGSSPDENITALKSYLESRGFSLHSLDDVTSGYIWAWMPIANAYDKSK